MQCSALLARSAKSVKTIGLDDDVEDDDDDDDEQKDDYQQMLVAIQ